MQDILISRKKECEAIKRCLSSSRSEFIVVKGRRRIGKTYLIDTFFKNKYDFTFVGEHNTPAKIQIQNFMRALQKQSNRKFPRAKNWYDAFNALEDYLETLPDKRKKVIFIDEMPWMDTQRSRFVSALENFWNGWAYRRKDIVMIATGSATSWMSEKLEKNKGGLHARVTEKLHLYPFNLHETEQYLRHLGCRWDRYQIVQCYMIFGGVPFYLSLLNPADSLVRNVDRLFYEKGAHLSDEFDELYYALFPNADSYVDIVKLLTINKSGMTRKEIVKETGLQGTFLTKVLKNLVRCDFVTQLAQYGSKTSNTLYYLTDFFTLFYNKFVADNHTKDTNWWSYNFGSKSVSTWMGFNFETVCIAHYPQIKAALGIQGVGSELSIWRSKPDKKTGKRFQIDMIIKRADRMVHLCEMKFCAEMYNLSQEMEEDLRIRTTLFREATSNNNTLVHTFVTPYGVIDGKHKSIIHSEVTMNALFSAHH